MPLEEGITEACFTTIPNILICFMENIFVTQQLGAIAILIIGAYSMHKLGLSYTASIPLSFVLIFSLFWISTDDTFMRIMALIMLLAIGLLGIALMRFFRR